jgi:uncharacterized membrane protein
MLIVLHKEIKRYHYLILLYLVLAFFFCGIVRAQDREGRMPREDVLPGLWEDDHRLALGVQ